MRAATAVQAFPNPFGQMRVILTLREARAIVLAGDPTTDFTWFEGYAWRIAYCAGCQEHLGWLFETIAAGVPPRFYGLLKDALIER
jgi:hypothetical protein